MHPSEVGDNTLTTYLIHSEWQDMTLMGKPLRVRTLADRLIHKAAPLLTSPANYVHSATITTQLLRGKLSPSQIANLD